MPRSPGVVAVQGYGSWPWGCQSDTGFSKTCCCSRIGVVRVETPSSGRVGLVGGDTRIRQAGRLTPPPTLPRVSPGPTQGSARLEQVHFPRRRQRPPASCALPILPCLPRSPQDASQSYAPGGGGWFGRIISFGAEGRRRYGPLGLGMQGNLSEWWVPRIYPVIFPCLVFHTLKWLGLSVFPR